MRLGPFRMTACIVLFRGCFFIVACSLHFVCYIWKALHVKKRAVQAVYSKEVPPRCNNACGWDPTLRVTLHLYPQLAMLYFEIVCSCHIWHHSGLKGNILLVQVRHRIEVLRTPSSTWSGFELMTSNSWQYIPCHWDACCNHSAISDLVKVRLRPDRVRTHDPQIMTVYITFHKSVSAIISAICLHCYNLSHDIFLTNL